MEGLLCGPEVAQINDLFQKAYSPGSDLIFFPIRHHSPACSYHLQKLIASMEPEIILIEGPDDTNNILKYLEHGESEAPLCIYYSYADKQGLLGGENGKYVCYYPFLDYSPELVAIREARDRGIPARFIDLPHPQILLNSKPGSRSPKVSYNDDYLLQRSKFLQGLCAREGCRNFHELWEKLFEIDGLRLDTAGFIKNMLAYCYLSKVDYNEELLEVEGCIAREKYMAQNIKKAREKYGKVLVVTGGYHTWGLIEFLQKENNIDLKVPDPGDTGTYAMAYSFEESDQLNGYASGMPHPAFYQKVWEGISAGEAAPYEQAVLHFIVRCGGRMRRNDTALSTADEIEALKMARGLTQLRDKAECGVYELFDGIRAAFVKGELNVFDKAPLEVLRKLLTGKKIGKLCGDAEVPPLVKDFRDKVKQLKLKSGTTVEQEIVLDLYKNVRHREISKFLHTMLFLSTGYCQKIKGPDFAHRKNTNLVRETWKYKWSPAVESSLIEVSVYGGSLRDAAGEILRKRFLDVGEHSGSASLLMIDALMMGLDNNLEEIISRVAAIISNDGSFYSTADCIYNLGFFGGAGKLLGFSGGSRLEKLVRQAYNKTVMLIPGLYNTAPEEENNIIARLKDVYQLCLRKEYGLDSQILADALFDLLARRSGNSSVEGAATGVLLGLGSIDPDYAVKRAEGYLYGTGENFLKSAGFLKGVFATARDIVFYGEEFLNGVNHMISSIQEEDFLRILPDLRLSFSFFTPNEIDGIGKAVANMYDTSKEDVLRVRAADSRDVRLGAELDKLCVEILRMWSIIDEQQ